MTTNQVKALELQEQHRANVESEALRKKELPAKYLSSVGTFIRGALSPFKFGGKTNVVSDRWLPKSYNQYTTKYEL